MPLATELQIAVCIASKFVWPQLLSFEPPPPRLMLATWMFFLVPGRCADPPDAGRRRVAWGNRHHPDGLDGPVRADEVHVGVGLQPVGLLRRQMRRESLERVLVAET